MKCPKCRAEIISNTLKTCPYCGTPLPIPLAVSFEKNKKAEHAVNHETNEIAKKIKEAIEAQKAIYKPEKANQKREKANAVKKSEKMEKVVERKKYSTSDIVILFVSLILTFIVLALALSLLLRR